MFGAVLAFAVVAMIWGLPVALVLGAALIAFRVLAGIVGVFRAL